MPAQDAYYQLLDVFIDHCARLNKGGKPYLTIMLCHELFRFLYPSEPYLNFQHTDPLRFMVSHLEKLIKAAEAGDASLQGYELKLEHINVPQAVRKRTAGLFHDLWKGYGRREMLVEGKRLIEKRIPKEDLRAKVAGKSVLDMGCGSGRYALALAAAGARSVTAVDYDEASLHTGRKYAGESGLPVRCIRADVLNLPFADRRFDFIFCNGVLHHTASWRAGVEEFIRCMGKAGFIYLYASGGVFWRTRERMRGVFKTIPHHYTLSVLDIMGVPGNREMFADCWHVPIEEHIKRKDLEGIFARCGVAFTKLRSRNPTDLDSLELQKLPGRRAMWGEGEHRYLLERL